ncbi:putative serine carboxypeptidase CPVL like protein [Argiope bruennichi]|uniref:Carboxypeptidase n=1 Tax=Argiope bruennichi TaxID=94029 RepID=A0A8T0E7R3_ARGBR|nr:putative serine carboxypeptidase CPVL like protein [Argiope bruennichi]
MTSLNSLLSLLFASSVFFPIPANEIHVPHARKNFDEFEPSQRNDPGQPLFLTPYIENGDIVKARFLSKVGKLPNCPDVPSYSGLFTVNKQHDSNMFFWFFPALNENVKAPVILWLQGGPGTSGVFGLFLEHGPYFLDSNTTAKLREYHWAKSFHVIYVDNPVGAGFSFTSSDCAYPTNQESVAKDLYEFLQQFFTLFHEYRNNDFYVAGESYGGKFVPSLAYKIHKERLSSKINFKGIAIGNGLCDPETMMDYSPYLYQLGLIDRKQAAVLQNLSDSILQHIRRNEYYEAFVEADKLLLPDDFSPYKNYFTNYTDYQFYYNYLRTKEPEDFNFYKSFINLPQVRKAIHVGYLAFQNGEKVRKNLLLDIMQSVKPEVTVLMNHYKVLFYSGQLDLCLPYPLTVNFLHSVQWKSADAYKNAERAIWKLDDGTSRIAGYVHNVGDFYEVLVRNAGHLVPYDQPKVALDLITRFIRGISFA